MPKHGINLYETSKKLKEAGVYGFVSSVWYKRFDEVLAVNFYVRSGGGSLLTKIWKLTWQANWLKMELNIGWRCTGIFSERFIEL